LASLSLREGRKLADERQKMVSDRTTFQWCSRLISGGIFLAVFLIFGIVIFGC
jgi:hypothetical protein